jgi:glutamine amidotransferase
MKKVLVVDYGVGNIKSICRALEVAGGQVSLVDDEIQISNYTHIVMPGVGTASVAMDYLRQRNLEEFILNFANEGYPILGVCLGMQLFSTKSFENGVTKCLNLIPGNVQKLRKDIKSPNRLPRIGWFSNQIIEPSDILFSGLSVEERFYYSHNYIFEPEILDGLIATTGNSICASIRKNNVVGIQFHPEKSGEPGIKLLSNFLNINERI